MYTDEKVYEIISLPIKVLDDLALNFNYNNNSIKDTLIDIRDDMIAYLTDNRDQLYDCDVFSLEQGISQINAVLYVESTKN